MLKYRALNPNVSPAKRLLQLTNNSIEAALAHRLHLAHVVEYPKCGGSWVRNMVRTYRNQELFTYDRLLRRGDTILCHRLFSRNIKKAIVVVRDPRDMYVSFYHYENSFALRNRHSPLFEHFQHDPERPLREDFHAYLEAKLLHPSHPWFYFSQFLDAWLNRPGTCLVRYEDCLTEPATQLASIIRFLGDPLDLDRLAEAVAATSFSAVTKEKYGQARKAGEADNTKFHRKGVSGDWKNHFNGDSCRLIETIEGRSLRRLGYETDASWIEDFCMDLEAEGREPAAPRAGQMAPAGAE